MRTLSTLSEKITAIYSMQAPHPSDYSNEQRQTILEAIKQLDRGHIQAAKKNDGKWEAIAWVKQAILLYFSIQTNALMPDQHTSYYDKIPLKFNNYNAADFQNLNIRVVPPAHVRYGAYIGERSILMPSYINIGAYIDEGCMIDTWATVGSCAHIGKHVHISGGAGIGGVLEPLQAQPTIIEDNCFIGARSEIVEGVVVSTGSVIAMGVYISQSTPIYNRATKQISYGYIPPYSVVIPGSIPSADGDYQKSAAIIVKQVDAQTRSKTAINQLLRDS